MWRLWQGRMVTVRGKVGAEFLLGRAEAPWLEGHVEESQARLQKRWKEQVSVVSVVKSK